MTITPTPSTISTIALSAVKPSASASDSDNDPAHASTNRDNNSSSSSSMSMGDQLAKEAYRVAMKLCRIHLFGTDEALGGAFSGAEGDLLRAFFQGV